MSLVDPTRPEPVAVVVRAGRGTVLVSLTAHVVFAALLVVVPLFGHVLLPTTATHGAIDPFVLAAAVPSVPAPVAATAHSPTTSAVTTTSTTAAASPTPVPLEAPTGIALGEPPAWIPGSASGGRASSGLGGVAGGLAGSAPTIGAPPPPSPPTTTPRRVGGDIRAPMKRRHVAPTYPAIAAQARVTGTVILEATIAPSGEVVDVRVLRSVPLLDAAAVEAVRQWRYDPPRLNGTPIAVLLTVTMRFDH